MNNQFIITVKNGEVNLNMEKATSLPDTLQILFTSILQVALHTQNQANHSLPPEQANLIKENIYDMINFAASNTLALFAPEIEMRPDLTADAILQKENEMINDEYNAIRKSSKQQPNPNNNN
jgi:hypothetical protein